MADRSIYTYEAALAEANAVAKSIADSTALVPTVGKIRLFDAPFVPDVASVKADLVAEETALGGYPAGGYAVDDMVPGALVSGGGAVITIPTTNVAFSVAPGATLAGGWLEDGGGKVRQVYIFDPPRAVMSVGEAFLLIRQMGFGRNA
jgi:hypothetical protein